jgi:3-hydroxyacyl-CoA dehydrogenase / enoyl-CoA hydratase / 3-hydroxybutyryl-CoA epimerase
VLRSARDGDVGAVFGIGFPPFRGGPFWYVDRCGAADVLARLRTLEARYGRRFAPAARLEEMARDGSTFFPEDG